MIEIQNLNVEIGGTKILEEITLPALRTGEIMGLIGPNAAGKSTLLRAIIGERKSIGQIDIDGEDVRAMNIVERRHALSYMPQILPQGSSLTPYELVYSFAKATDLALYGSGLDARIEELFSSLGLVEEAHRSMQVLSGGKRQLVGLCLTMIHQPKVLLLDEPTSALDLHWQLAAINVVRKYVGSGDNSAIIALHDVNLALRFCDRLAVLKDGKVFAAGMPSKVINPELISDVYAVSARVEKCSQNIPFLLADRPI